MRYWRFAVFIFVRAPRAPTVVIDELESGPRYDQHVAGLHSYVLLEAPVVEQVIESNTDLGMSAVSAADDPRTVAGRELRQPAHVDDHVEDGHPRAILQGLRRGRFADDANLLLRLADEPVHDDRDDRGADVLSEDLL